MLLLWNDMACRIVTNKIHFQVFHLALATLQGMAGGKGVNHAYKVGE